MVMQGQVVMNSPSISQQRNGQHSLNVLNRKNIKIRLVVVQSVNNHQRR
jgi:hypothetical protein